MINVITLFSGYDSQCLALNRLGVEYDLVAWSEIDRYAIKAHDALFPQFAERNVGDVSKVDWSVIDKPIGLLTYSSPCFVAGTLVLTDKGYKSIENLLVGDRVLTHTSRYSRVVKVGNKPSDDIYQIKGMMFDEIVCTGNHPFYVREMYRYGHESKRMFHEPQWVEAKDLTKKHYLGYAINTESRLPQWDGSIDNRWGHNKRVNNLLPLLDKADFWYLMGRYVGDGWRKESKNGNGIVICHGGRNADSLYQALDNLDLHYNLRKERTATRIVVCMNELADFVSRYGYYAYGKHIDDETLSLPISLLKSFVDGMVDSDGCYTNNEYKITTVSRELAYGISQCVAKVYHRHTKLNKTIRPPKHVIEGRIVNQKDTYSVSWHIDKRTQDHAFYEDGKIWFPISRIEQTKSTETVYNIEVEDDHTYTANGAIVHNCQDFSTAGLQRGGEKGSGTRSSLLWEVERAVETLRPKYLLMENVSALVGKNFRALFERWLATLQGYGYKSYYQVLNAKDYGVPQNRKRVFAVSKLTDADPSPYYFPKPFKLERLLKDVLEQSVDERYYLSDEKVAALLAQTPSKEDISGGVPNARMSRTINKALNETKADYVWLDAYVNAAYEDVAPTLTTRIEASGNNKILERQGNNFISEPRCICVGNIVSTGNFENKQRGRVYDANGISPCLNTETGGGFSPKIVVDKDINDIHDKDESTDVAVSEENIDSSHHAENTWNISEPSILTPKRTEYGKSVRKKYGDYNITESRHNLTVLEPKQDGTSNTITTVAKDNMLVEPCSHAQTVNTCAMHGRDKYNPNDRGRSTENYEQRPEIGSEDVSNTITTAAKDSMVIEKSIISPGHGYFAGAENTETCPTVKCSAMQAQHFVKEQEVLGWTRVKKGDIIDRHPVDVANCVTAGKRDNTQNYVKETEVPTIIEDFYANREPRTYSEASPTIRGEREGQKVCNGIRIRYLTERELFRLMDVDEKDIDTLLSAGISKTQLSKMAGNSIVVACLYHIFDRLFIHNEAQGNEQMKLF